MAKKKTSAKKTSAEAENPAPDPNLSPEEAERLAQAARPDDTYTGDTENTATYSPS